MKKLHREEEFQSKNYLLEMPRSHARMHLKIAPQKLNFVMAKGISNNYTLDYSCKYSCTLVHSHASHSLVFIKTTLCETNNIFFSKNS